MKTIDYDLHSLKLTVIALENGWDWKAIQFLLGFPSYFHGTLQDTNPNFMHYYWGNPSNFAIHLLLVWSPKKNGSKLNDPCIFRAPLEVICQKQGNQNDFPSSNPHHDMSGEGLSGEGCYLLVE